MVAFEHFPHVGLPSSHYTHYIREPDRGTILRSYLYLPFFALTTATSCFCMKSSTCHGLEVMSARLRCGKMMASQDGKMNVVRRPFILVSIPDRPTILQVKCHQLFVLVELL